MNLMQLLMKIDDFCSPLLTNSEYVLCTCVVLGLLYMCRLFSVNSNSLIYLSRNLFYAALVKVSTKV